MPAEQATVLLVDDDPEVREVYADILEVKATYAVETASDGDEALERMGDHVDLVLLDRRMPGRSGDEVLEELRDRGSDVPVIMVTAVDPGPEVITLSFNDYLTKPVSSDELLDGVERALMRSERDIQMQEYFALVAKREALADAHTDDELADHPEYRDLMDRIADLRDRIDPAISDFEDRLAVQLSDEP